MLPPPFYGYIHLLNTTYKLVNSLLAPFLFNALYIMTTPVHWCTLMVAKCKVSLLGREVCLHETGDRLQDKQLVIAGLVPHVMSWKIPSHIDPVKLNSKKEEQPIKSTKSKSNQSIKSIKSIKSKSNQRHQKIKSIKSKSNQIKSKSKSNQFQVDFQGSPRKPGSA